MAAVADAVAEGAAEDRLHEGRVIGDVRHHDDDVAQREARALGQQMQ